MLPRRLRILKGKFASFPGPEASPTGERWPPSAYFDDSQRAVASLESASNQETFTPLRLGLGTSTST
jgi:hypothetical protein